MRESIERPLQFFKRSLLHHLSVTRGVWEGAQATFLYMKRLETTQARCPEKKVGSISSRRMGDGGSSVASLCRDHLAIRIQKLANVKSAFLSRPL